ncbi:MAG: ABC transporter ATP-binding protein [Granulosicoccus sp.]
MADHLLQVCNLSVDFQTSSGWVHAVRNVSWHLDKGEVLAILGESGSGKSVSASAILGLVDCPPGRISSGQILYGGNDLLAITKDQRLEINGRRIAMIFQDPLSHLNPVYSVGWQIAEALRIHGMSRQQIRHETHALLERVGIDDVVQAVHKYPHQFSGGQRQRVMIAMALAVKPEILIADEPTTALDVTVQAQILSLLETLQRETGMALLLITHDLGVVAEMADRVLIMNHGEIVEQGSAQAVYHHPKHAYTRQLIESVPGKGALSDVSTETASTLLSVRGLGKRFGHFVALKDIDFEMREGECLAIVGESGSGKSTLARCIVQLTEPSDGEVLYLGRNLFTLTDRQLLAIRRDIQMVFQDPSQSLNPRMTVYDIISEAWVIHREILPKSQWRDRVAELLQQVGLPVDAGSRYAHQFSGGQRQRIAIARALALQPKIIICDEAVSALDVQVQAQVIDLLAALRKQLGIAYVFIAHDLPLVRDFADRVIVMQAGRIVEQDSVRRIFDNPRQLYTQRLLAASLDPDPQVQAERRRVRDEEEIKQPLAE